MTAEENLRVIRRCVDAFNARDWKTYLSNFAESVVTLEPDEVDPIQGTSGLKKRVSTYTGAFPDVKLKIERLFGDDTWVCLNTLFIGTHGGPLPRPGGGTVPATHKPVSVQGCSVFKFERGKITQFIGYYDQIELFNQIGVKP